VRVFSLHCRLARDPARLPTHWDVADLAWRRLLPSLAIHRLLPAYHSCCRWRVLPTFAGHQQRASFTRQPHLAEYARRRPWVLRPPFAGHRHLSVHSWWWWWVHYPASYVGHWHVPNHAWQRWRVQYPTSNTGHWHVPDHARRRWWVLRPSFAIHRHLPVHARRRWQWRVRNAPVAGHRYVTNNAWRQVRHATFAGQWHVPVHSRRRWRVLQPSVAVIRYLAADAFTGHWHLSHHARR
jgi:hypothetical protein